MADHHEHEFKFCFLEGNIIVLIEIRIELRGEKFCMGIGLAVPKIWNLVEPCAMLKYLFDIYKTRFFLAFSNKTHADKTI